MAVALIVLAAAIPMMWREYARPGRAWPRVAGWWARALALNAAQAGAVFLAGATWDGWMKRHRPWSADGLGLVAGTLCGYLALTFVYYWWHRLRHESAFLWRWLHQVHHSAERIEVLTSFYKHPLEVVANGLLSSAVLYLALGLSPAAASAAVTLTGLAELVYHWNVSTPRWLGYVFQRPESHCVHHQEGLHRYNYSDLPLWDMLFGTFHNPARWEGRCGLGAGTSERLKDMLRGVDTASFGDARS